jgi:lauroyl/myristoyl acyltransferase
MRTTASSSPRWYSHGYNRAAFYRLASAAIVLPRRVRLALAARLASLAARAMPIERSVVRANMRRVTGADGARLEALTRGVFREFAMCFADLVSTNRRAERLERYLHGVSGAEAALRSLEVGVISLTAHLGNWELGGRLLARRFGRPTNVVVAGDEQRSLERWLRRDGDGMKFVARSRPASALRLLAALRRGETVAAQGDRALGGRGDVLVPFFGTPAPFPLGPFVLARASGARLVPAFCVMENDQRYHVTVHEPFTVKAGGEESALRHWVSVLEGEVRAHPTQWFNFYDVWNPFDA